MVRPTGRGVGADRHKAGVSKRELTSVAIHQIQANRQNDVDTDIDENVVIVGVTSYHE